MSLFESLGNTLTEELKTLLTELLKLILEANGFTLDPEGKVCSVADPSDCQSINAWYKAAVASAYFQFKAGGVCADPRGQEQTASIQYLIKKETVEKRIRGLYYTGETQTNENSCWAANGLMLRDYMNTAANKAAPEPKDYTRVKEKKELIQLLPTIRASKLFEVLSKTVEQNNLPRWYLKGEGPPEDEAERVNAANTINTCFRDLINRFHIQNTNNELSSQTIASILEELSSVFSETTSALIINTAWSGTKKEAEYFYRYYLYLIFWSNSPTDDQQTLRWFKLLGFNSRPFVDGVPDMEKRVKGMGLPVPDMKTVQNLLQKAPICLYLNGTGFWCSEEKLESIVSNKEHPVDHTDLYAISRHAIVLYDLFLNNQTGKYMVRYINTDPGLPTEELDPYAYSFLGLTTPKHQLNLYTPEDGTAHVEFRVMSFKKFSDSVYLMDLILKRDLSEEDYSGYFWGIPKNADNKDHYS